MKRAMARQAEGEYQASTKLAADVISWYPVALQLRYLQTVVEISAEKNSTTIFPLPIELFAGLIEKATGVKAGGFASGKEEAGEGPEARLLQQGVDREEVARLAKRVLGLGTKTRKPAVLDEDAGRTE